MKVTLMETDPPIWRRLIVPGDTTLAELGRIIQAAMGWTNSHLHTFTVGGVLYAEPSPEWEVEVRDERRARLADVAREEGEAFVYEYDLGDSWRHQVLVEEVIAGGARVWVESMTGGPFDPDAFDLEAANESIEALRFRRRRG